MVIRTLLQESGIDRLDAEVLLAHVLKIPREKLLFSFNMPVPIVLQASFSALCEKRKKGCPVAYLIGEKEFYGLPFYVNESTLIPRPDTELLVEWAIEKAEGKRVLDVCTGTGCIGISVAKNAHISALTLADISAEALSVSQKNADRLSVRAAFFQLDILKDSLPGQFDLILSNPPYIESDVIPTLERDVQNYEPHLALDGGADGLDFYPVIIKKAYAALSPGGWLGLEIGFAQGEAVSGMMHPFFEEVRILYDLAGHMRAVVGRKKSV